MNVLFDVNVYVSAFISASPATPPVRLLQAVREGVFAICVSRELLDELEAVLARPKIQKLLTISPAELSAFMAELEILLGRLSPLPVIPSVSRDKKDDYILATALQTKADVIVTGDQDLLVLKLYQNIPIITPRQFLDVIFGAESAT